VVQVREHVVAFVEGAVLAHGGGRAVKLVARIRLVRAVCGRVRLGVGGKHDWRVVGQSA
jgi:hypothetical protein